MAPRGRPRKTPAASDPVKSRVKLVGDALEAAESEDLPERVIDFLQSTMHVTLGQQKPTRHPFNERVVGMIGEVMQAHLKRLETAAEEKRAKFEEIKPTRETREAAMEEAKNVVTEKIAALEAAKTARAEQDDAVKNAIAATAAAKEAQEAGDAGLKAVEEKKIALAAVQDLSLKPLLEGSVGTEERSEKVSAVLETAKNHPFDGSMLQAVEQVLVKDKADRTGFDDTCTEQLSAAFDKALGDFQAELDSGAAGKTERQEAVDKAQADEESARVKLGEMADAQSAAKQAKDEAQKAAKEAKQSFVDFMPELKRAGDEADEAKADLEHFNTGALAAYNDLKEWTEGCFDPPAPAEEPAAEAEGAAVEESPSKKQKIIDVPDAES